MAKRRRKKDTEKVQLPNGRFVYKKTAKAWERRARQAARMQYKALQRIGELESEGFHFGEKYKQAVLAPVNSHLSESQLNKARKLYSLREVRARAIKKMEIPYTVDRLPAKGRKNLARAKVERVKKHLSIEIKPGESNVQALHREALKALRGVWKHRKSTYSSEREILHTLETLISTAVNVPLLAKKVGKGGKDKFSELLERADWPKIEEALKNPKKHTEAQLKLEFQRRVNLDVLRGERKLEEWKAYMAGATRIGMPYDEYMQVIRILENSRNWQIVRELTLLNQLSSDETIYRIQRIVDESGYYSAMSSVNALLDTIGDLARDGKEDEAIDLLDEWLYNSSGVFK